MKFVATLKNSIRAGLPMYLSCFFDKPGEWKGSAVLDGVLQNWTLMLTYKNGVPNGREAAVLYCDNGDCSYMVFHGSDAHILGMKESVMAALRQTPQYESLDCKIAIDEVMQALDVIAPDATPAPNSSPN